MVEVNMDQADLTGCRVYGASVWKASLDQTKQIDLIITPRNEPVITVDHLEVAQFVYLLLNHRELREVLDTVTQKGVLLLGRFSAGGLDLLRAVAQDLRHWHYLPIIFDFDRPADRTYTETVKTLVGLSRFVIVELSGPSVPQELYATVPHYKVPYVPILLKGSRPFAMFADLLEYPWVLSPPVEYKDQDDMRRLLESRVVRPAEEMAKARGERLKQIFDR